MHNQEQEQNVNQEDIKGSLNEDIILLISRILGNKFLYAQSYLTKLKEPLHLNDQKKLVKTNLKTVLLIGQQLNLTFEIFHLFVTFTRAFLDEI